MDDNCKLISQEFKDAIQTLVTNWRNVPTGSQRASFSVMKQLREKSDGKIDSLTEEAKNNIIAEYFEQVILSSISVGEEPKVPTVHQMDTMLSEYQQKLDDEAAEKQGALERIPILVGAKDYSRDFDLVDIINNDIGMDSKKRRKALADIVDRNLRRNAGKDYLDDVHGKIVRIIEGNKYSGNVELLFRAMVLASKTDHNGLPMLDAETLIGLFNGDKSAINNINSTFEGNSFNEGKDYSPLEARIMREIVDLYLAQNKEVRSKLQDAKNRTIRATSTATRAERVLANALRDVRDSFNAEEIDFSNPSQAVRNNILDCKLSFSVTRDLLQKTEDALRAWADRQDQKRIQEQFNTYGQTAETKWKYNGNPFDGLAEYMVSVLGEDFVAYNPQSFVSKMMDFLSGEIRIKRDINGNITKVEQGTKELSADWFAAKYNPGGDGSLALMYWRDKNYERNEDGSLSPKSLSSEEVTDLLTSCYEVATSRYNMSDSSIAFQQALVATKGQNFVYGSEPQSNGKLNREAIGILEDIRETLLVEQAKDDDERAEHDEYAKDEELVNKNSLETRRMTTTACAAVYDSKTLQARTEAVFGGILGFVNENRWPEVARAESLIQENKLAIQKCKADIEKYRELIKHPERWKDEIGTDFFANSKARNLSEKAAMQAIIDNAEKRIEELTKEWEDLKQYIKDIYDDNLFFAAILKRNMAAALAEGENRVLKTGTDYQANEATTAKKVIDELKVRALSLLEERTGVRIILNRRTLQYDVADDTKNRDINREDTTEDEDEDGVFMRNDDMDFTDQVDPFAHLSVQLRFALSRIPKTDFAGNEITDDLGNRQYWDPRDIYAGLMDLCNDLVVDPEDLYTLKKKGLDNKNKEYPVLNKMGRKRKGSLGRTAKDAFPLGQPQFDILRENADRYPWVNQLIDTLEEDWVEFSVPNSVGPKPRMGKLTTNLFAQLGHTFMRRMQVKDSAMVVSNETSDIQNAKATQRHMFYTKSMLSNSEGKTLTMLWDTAENGKSGAVVVRDKLDAIINGGVNFTGYSTGTVRNKATDGSSTKAKDDAKLIGDALRSMGLDIDYKSIENILAHGNSTKISRLRNLIRYCKYAALHCANNPNAMDIYENNYNNWKKIYELAGPLVRTKAHLVTSTENGKTRQNYILPNAFTTRFDTLGYGSATMRRGRNESYADENKFVDPKILKKRQEKIDAMYRDVPGMFDTATGKYRNRLLQLFYEGNIDIGQYMQSDTYEGKDYRQLSMEEQLCMQLAAFEKPKVGKGKIGQPEYIQFCSMADVPIAQFISVDYGEGIDGAVDAITQRILGERETIQAHKANRRPYIISYAIANDKVRKDYTGYYNAIEGKWMDVPSGSVETFKATVEYVRKLIKLQEKYDQAENDAQRKKAQEDITKHKTKNAKYVELSGINSADEYVAFSKWQPRQGYFTREEKYGEVPDINTLKLDRYDIADAFRRITDKKIAAKGKKITDEERAEIEQELHDRMDSLAEVDTDDALTMDDMLDRLDNDVLKDVARVYVDRAMQDRFRRYMGKLRVPFREYSEKANLNRIERTLRGEPDFDGEYWDIQEDDEHNLILVSLSGEHRRPVTLNDAEAAYAKNRMESWEKSNAKRDFEANADLNPMTYSADLQAAMQEYFSRKKEGEIDGTKTKHKFTTILDFQPPLRNQEDMRKVIQTRRSTTAKGAKVGFEDVHKAIQRVFYHTFAANTEMLELFGMRSAMFKSPDDLTKRLKMLYSNGLRFDTNNGGGQKDERLLILADYTTQMSSDLENKVREFAEAADAGEISKDDALQKILQYTNINATDAQGHLLPKAYDVKTTQAGSAYNDSRKAETLEQIKSGNPRFESDPTYSVGTIKQIGMGTFADRDPRGRVEMIPVGVKNSEAILLSADNIPNAKRSATMMAVERYCSNEDNKFSDGTQIDSIQRESGVKTSKKGVLALHYVEERVRALCDLAKMSTVSQQQAQKFADEWAKEVDNVMSLDADLVVSFNRLVKKAAGGKNKDFVTFNDIDNWVHGEIKEKVTKYLNTNNSAEREEILDEIKTLRDLVSFMLPVKSTERTIKQLNDVIDRAVRNEDGSMNDQYVMTIERKWQHAQIRPTNHSMDSKAHLGSQMSYIMQTAIDFKKEDYKMPNGELISGKTLYHKFNEALAHRLLLGAKEAGRIFSDLKELRSYMINIIQNNPKYGPEMIRAIDIIDSAVKGTTGKNRFSTPLSSVAVIYKVSDILTSIIRGKTHRRPVNGGAVVIEADTMYDDNLGIARDEDGNMLGVECYMPAWAEDIVKRCLKNGRRKRIVNGVEVTETYEYLDFNKIKGTGLEEMIGYRIPSEDMHSILPLIVKGFLPQSRGSAIVVAKEIVTLTGGDNDIDKLFLMIKHINKTAEQGGKLMPVPYDIDQPLTEQSEQAVENMLVDLTRTILTDRSNAARFASPQNPDSLTDIATIVAHNSLPYEQQMKVENKPQGRLVYRPEDPNWNNSEYYKTTDTTEVPGQTGLEEMSKHIDFLDTRCVNDLCDMCYFKDMHALAKLGVAIAADNTSIFSKVMAGAESVQEDMSFKFKDWAKLPEGITIDGKPLSMYCPRNDISGGSAYENCSNFAATLVDSGNSPDVKRLGITLQNASLAAFFLRCGLTLEMMGYMINIIANTPHFKNRYNSLYKKLTKDSDDGSEKGKLADKADFGSFSIDDLRRAQALSAHGGLMNEDTLGNDVKLMSVLHVMNYLMSVHDNIMPWTKTLKMNSTKHALSNEPASAVYAQMLVEDVEQRAAKGDFLINIPTSMVIHSGLTAEHVANGTFVEDNGVVKDSGVHMVQAYYTCGIEMFGKVMDKRLFYAHPAFKELVNAFKETIMAMPKDDAVAFIKLLHDEFSTFYLSGSNMVKDDFVTTRNYYRNEFPRMMSQTLKGGDKLKQKYAIIDVLMVKDGRLMINDDRMSDKGVSAVRDSLVKMASSPVKAERDMARDLFMNAFFTDGLRFGYGSVSKVFTPSFLAHDAFKDYNDAIDALCDDRLVTGKDLQNFMQQFICNNYNSKTFAFGPLVRAVSSATKNDEGFWEPVENPEDLSLRDDEVSYKDVHDLEQWLTRGVTNGRLMLDIEDDVVQTPDGKKYPVPRGIIDMVERLGLEAGEVFRLQTSFSPYDQNLYMVDDAGNGQLCIIKLNDFLSPKVYDRNATFRINAERNCKVSSRGKAGVWNVVLTGAALRKNEMRKAFLSGGLNSYLKSINEKTKERKEEAERREQNEGVITQRETVSASEYTESVRVDGTEAVSAADYASTAASSNGLFDDEFKKKQEADKAQRDKQLKRAKYKGGQMTQVSLTGEESEALAAYSQTDDNGNGRSQLTEFFEKEDGTMYMGSDIKAMYDIDTDDDADYIEQQKEELLRSHGADTSFSTRQEAINAASQINNSQDDFVAVVEQEGDAFVVTLADSMDDDAAHQWAEQYGQSVMTGTNGINSVMNKTGNSSEGDFVSFSNEYEMEDYNDEIEDLIELIRNSRTNGKFPKITKKTAEDVVRRMRKVAKVNGFYTNLKRVLMDAANGDAMSTTAVMELLGYIDTIGPVLERIRCVSDINDEALEREATAIIVEALSDSNATSRRLERLTVQGSGTPSEWIAKKFRDQLLAGIMGEMKKLTDEDIDTLRDIKSRAVANHGTLTPEERHRLDAQNRRNANTLNEIDRLTAILYDALQMEEQKRKMLIEENQDTATSKDRIEVLQQILGDETSGPNIHGVVNYLSYLMGEYRFCANVFSAIPDNSKQDNLEGLYKVKRILQSHEQMLEALKELMDDPAFMDKFNDLYRVVGSDDAASIRELVEHLVELNSAMRNQYAEHASKEFIGFIKEFVGENDTVEMPDGTTVTWDQLMEQYDGDISFFDKWLRSMSDTDDPIGQLYNRVVQKQKDKARNDTIRDQQGEIQELNGFIIENGIDNFEFMFEHDENGKKTGYYLSDTDNGRFYKELEEKQAERDEVLNDRHATKEEKTAAKAAYDSWYRTHAVEDRTGHVTPNKSMYASAEYERLRMEEPKKFEFLEKFMKIKRKYDARLGAHTNNNRAIQRRMTSEQRFKANFTLSPKQLWENTKRKLAEDYLVQEDDYMEAGQTSTVLNFDGTRRMVMPAPYVRMLKNPDELSTDPIGCLVAYSYATNNYVAMREIVNPLEVGFDAMLEGRIQYEMQNGRRVVEQFKNSERKRAIVKESRFFQKLRSFMDSQLYMRYIADADDTFKIFGMEFRRSKTVNAFLHMSAVAQLGFNWLVDLANLANGVAQTNIEAAARRFFRGATLLQADKEYMKALQEFIPDLSNPIKRSKLALVGEKLNIMQNFDVKVYNNRRNSLISKLFNSNVAFLGTSCGNHWLYNRVAIAMMLETEVTLADGTKTNLWDALETVDNDFGGKTLRIKDGAKIDGQEVTDEWLSDFGRRIAKVNQSLLGIYNRDDMVMAQKLSMTKLLIAFRKHIMTMMDKRYRKRHRVAEFAGTDQEWQEGYMRTLGRFLIGLHEAGYKIPAVWPNLTEQEKQNVWMAVTDIAQWAALFMLMNLLCFKGDDDDDDDEYLEKMCKFLLSREAHELGSMLPTLYMPKEGVNIINQPFMGTGQLEDLYNFCSTAMQPWTWDERVKAGPFQGQSQIEMRFRKLPIPVLSYYRNIDKSLNGIDNSTWFYNRGYVGGGGRVGKS